MVNKKISPISIHLIAWIIVAMLHYVITEFNAPDSLSESSRMQHWLIPFSMLIIKFYINYLWLIDHYFFKKRYTPFLVINIVLWISTFVLARLIIGCHSCESDNLLHIIAPFGFTSILFAHLIILFFSQVAPALGIKIAERWYGEQQLLRNIEKAQIDMELQNLRSQLNPHFLFNSLNSVYALIAFRPKEAQSSLLNICDLLRYQLYEARTETITLEKEIKFIENYCDLMKLRLSVNTEVMIDLPSDTCGIKIAPLLFISIIENAFKHGVDPKKESYISLHISVIGSIINCTVKNSNHPKEATDQSGSGIGLANLQRRLELLYPHNHTFDREVVGLEHRVKLTINTAKI